MTNRKDKQFARALAQQREMRISALLESGKIKAASEIPEDSIPAAIELQNHNGTWFPPLFYQNIPFVCKDCGKHEVWTATQQRWYYEVAKGPVQAQANRCRPCRKKHQAGIEKQRELLKMHSERKASKSRQHDVKAWNVSTPTPPARRGGA